MLYVVSAFFFGMMVGPANPFVTTHDALAGLGPNSLLQDNPLVAIHPPLLYAGFVGFTVPFAFAIAMLATGRIGDRWQIECRRWTLVSFTLLSVGIVLGAWWSYQVLGWGGFWGWDPVENAALLPWLCGTAYLHSVLVQERRGLMRVWNLSLSVATFALTILGPFLTRSGVINSVHAFSESSLGPILIGFFFAVIIVGFGLIAWRGDRLRSPGGIDAPLGREGAFLLNNLLFVGFAFVVLLGTLYPILYEAVTQQQVNVAAPFFNTVAVPVGLALLFLMAVAPALSWRKINGSVLWQRLAIPIWVGVLTVVLCVAVGLRGLDPLVGFGLGAFAAATAVRALVLSIRATRMRQVGWWRGLIGRTNGGMVVHLGVIVMAVGIIAATTYRHQTELALRQGKVVTYDGHRLRIRGVAHRDDSLEAVGRGPGQGGWRRVRAGHHQLRWCVGHGGHSRHRLGCLGRRLPHLRSGRWPGKHVGQLSRTQPAGRLRGHRRGDRTLVGLVVGRRSPGGIGWTARPCPRASAGAPPIRFSAPFGHGHRRRQDRTAIGPDGRGPDGDQPPGAGPVRHDRWPLTERRYRSKAVPLPRDDSWQTTAHDTLGRRRGPPLPGHRRCRAGDADPAGSDPGRKPTGRAHGTPVLGRQYFATHRRASVDAGLARSLCLRQLLRQLVWALSTGGARPHLLLLPKGRQGSC